MLEDTVMTACIELYVIKVNEEVEIRGVKEIVYSSCIDAVFFQANWRRPVFRQESSCCH